MQLNLDKIGAPLAIAASIVGIWVYLRQKSSPTQAIVNNPATNVPGVGVPIPGLTQVLFAPTQGGGVGGPPQAVPSTQNTIAASQDPTNPNPAAPPSTIPAYLTYNFSPQFAFSKLPLLAAMSDSHMNGTPKKGCGCGGSCGGSGGGGCSTCVSRCDQINARFPDGRGGCFSKSVNPKYVQATQNNIAGYLVSESIVPTAPYLGVANG